MKLLTQRDRIRRVVAGWSEGQFGGDRHEVVLARLSALDLETVDAETINEIIGNDSWTMQDCNDCGSHVADAVIVGAEMDYDSPTAVLCRSCAEKAAGLFSGVTP